MGKKWTVLLWSCVMVLWMAVGIAVPVPAASEAQGEKKEAEVLSDGIYTAVFATDNAMFHVSEANDGRGILTVEDGRMTIHVSLASKNIVNLFCGSAEDAKKDGADLLEPTVDEVTYDDGMTDEVYGFDIPVPALDEPFAVALIGKKGKWYDHNVTVSDPVERSVSGTLPDGVYAAEVTLSGGTGKASIESPCEITVTEGEITADILWSSPHYDYMIVGEETCYPVNESGNSRFLIPVVLGEEMAVQADTTAMSQPHLIEYALTFTLAENSGIEKTAEGSGTGAAEEKETSEAENASGEEVREEPDGSFAAGMLPPEIPGLRFVSAMGKKYAEEFAVFYYENGYKVLAASSGRMYLLVPEAGTVPENLPQGMTVLQAPLRDVYLAASSAMALVHALDALDAIAFSGTEAGGWYIEDAASAMESGEIRFAGKYSQPDYEGLLAGGCDLAVESTMILHTPEVQEKLEALGIPVLIDESSHESHPLGRTEWIRFYGALLDKEKEADAFFAGQEEILGEMEEAEKSGKTVAYFFVNSSGSVVVRRTEDYIPKMIELAGGTYVFQDLNSPNAESGSGSVALSMEEFYAQAGDCDYLIYNAAIEGPLDSIDELIGKDPVFADFRAVKEGHVYTTDKDMYQATDSMGELIRDIHRMLTGSEESDMLFLRAAE